PDLAVDRHVVDRSPRSGPREELSARRSGRQHWATVGSGLTVEWSFDDDRGKAQELEVFRERAVDALLAVALLDRREEADLAEVDGEHRHVGTHVALQCPQDRTVAAEDDAQVDGLLDGGVDLDALGALERVLAGLLGVKAERRALRARLARERVQGLCRIGGLPVREHRDPRQGSTSRASRSRSPAGPP